MTKYIRIGIGDKNDNPPFFDQAQYEAEVNEDEDIQHTVITVTAKDKDESSKIRYEITRGNIGGAFAVKNETGAIYVAGPLDYENRKEVSELSGFHDAMGHTMCVQKGKEAEEREKGNQLVGQAFQSLPLLAKEESTVASAFTERQRKERLVV